MMATTAAEALERFERTSDGDLAVTYFHEGKTPRQHPSAILRVIGDELKGAAECPPRIMPLWLANAAGPLFDARVRKGIEVFPDGAAKAWGLRFYGELKRLDGRIPFSVIHDWHATAIGPMIVTFSQRPEPNPWLGADPPQALAALHAAALAGRRIAADEWRPVLHDAFVHIHARGRLGPAVTATRRYTLDETVVMEADAYASAYAATDADAFAQAHWNDSSGLDAYAGLAVAAYRIIQTHAKLLADPDPNYDRYQYLGNMHACIALARLADGLVDCLARVAP